MSILYGVIVFSINTRYLDPLHNKSITSANTQFAQSSVGSNHQLCLSAPNQRCPPLRLFPIRLLTLGTVFGEVELLPI